MNFRRDPSANTNLTSMQAYLSSVSEAALGPRNPDGYWDPEGGYDGDEWTYVSDDGRVAKVYTRWGCFRVGAHDYRTAVELALWLRANGCPDISCDKVDLDVYMASMAVHAAINAWVQEGSP